MAEKIKIGNNARLYPMPVSLVGTKVRGKTNFMTVGWGHMFGVVRGTAGQGVSCPKSGRQCGISMSISVKAKLEEI